MSSGYGVRGAVGRCYPVWLVRCGPNGIGRRLSPRARKACGPCLVPTPLTAALAGPAGVCRLRGGFQRSEIVRGVQGGLLRVPTSQEGGAPLSGGRSAGGACDARRLRACSAQSAARSGRTERAQAELYTERAEPVNRYLKRRSGRTGLRWRHALSRGLRPTETPSPTTHHLVLPHPVLPHSVDHSGKRDQCGARAENQCGGTGAARRGGARAPNVDALLASTARTRPAQG